MATSGSVNYNLNARDAIQTALELIQTCAIGLASGPEEAATALTHANLMLKTWGTHSHLWINTEATIPLVAAQAAYSLPLARRVLSVRRRVGTGTGINDTPLIPMSRSDYFDYPSKAARGLPFQFYFDPQRATRTLYVINVPGTSEAASTTLNYTYSRVIEDLDDLINDIDIPQEWLEAFVYCLAARLMLPFRTFVTDAITASKIEERARELFAELTADDQEDTSMFIQPAYPF